MSPAGAPHGRVTVKLDHRLVIYTDAHPEWIGYGTDTAFTLASGSLRCPDAALVPKRSVSRAAILRVDLFPSRPILLSRSCRLMIPELRCRASARTITRMT